MAFVEIVYWVDHNIKNSTLSQILQPACLKPVMDRRMLRDPQSYPLKKGWRSEKTPRLVTAAAMAASPRVYGQFSQLT